MHSHFSLTHYRVYFAKDLNKGQSDSICQVIYLLPRNSDKSDQLRVMQGVQFLSSSR